MVGLLVIFKKDLCQHMSLRTAAASSPVPGAAPSHSCLCRRPSNTYRQICVSLLWGHCFFLLGAGMHRILYVPSKNLFPQFCVGSGGVNGDLLQEGLCHIQVCCTQSPCPCGSPLLTRTSTGDTQTQFCLSLCGTEYIL